MSSRVIDRVTLLNITLFVEAFLLLTATFWTQMSDIQLAAPLRFEPSKLLLGAGAGAGMAVVSLILFWLGRSLKPLQGLREIVTQQIAPIFSDITFVDVLLVAAVSGFCEEVLFRGVIQQQLGLLGTSVIFGLFHCPNLRHLGYGIWATAAGLFLGWLYIHTGSLWAPIVAHAVSNSIALTYVRYCVKVEAPPDNNEDADL